MHHPDHLEPCPSCSCHVQGGETQCPHCGASLGVRLQPLPRTARAVALGLVLLSTTGCIGSVGAKYGMSDTDSDYETEESESESESESDSGDE